ncbi:MAG: hypothetical protein ACD_56C00012G0006 [uncultured bacterium]|nr:MAG: hypothetical protein ACD_56C00012G0006 [uncultured bacterium]
MKRASGCRSNNAMYVTRAESSNVYIYLLVQIVFYAIILSLGTCIVFSHRSLRYINSL